LVLGLRPEVHRLAPPEERHLARPERHCSVESRDAAAVLRREGQLREVAPFVIPAVQPGSLMELRLVRPEAVRPAVPDAVRCPARPSVAAVQMVRVPQRAEVAVAQPLAAEPKGALRPAEQPGALAEAAAEVQREEEAPPALAAQPKVAPGVLAEWDAAAGPQPGVASVAAGVRQPEAEAAPDVAAAVLPQVEVAERGAAEVALPPAAVLDVVAEVLRQAARGAPGVLLLAAAWAALLSTRLRGDRPAPSPQVRSARAREVLRIAQP
jgi:hypothetical protein